MRSTEANKQIGPGCLGTRGRPIDFVSRDDQFFLAGAAGTVAGAAALSAAGEPAFGAGLAFLYSRMHFERNFSRSLPFSVCLSASPEQ